MWKIMLQKYIPHLICILSINLIYQSSVFKCQVSSKRSETIVPKSNAKKQNLGTLLRSEKAIIAKDKQRLVEEIENSTSLITKETTIGIDTKDVINSTTNGIDSNSTLDPTLDPTSLTINETDITTPLFSSKDSSNDSLVPIIDETPDNKNGTERDSEESLTTQLSTDSTTPITTNNTFANPTVTSEMPFMETPTTLTYTSNQSPISTTDSTTTTTIPNNVKLEMGLNEDISQCIFETKIDCKGLEITCYGRGEIDCGVRNKRSLNNSRTLDVYKLSLERRPQSETIINTKCVLTPHENHYLSCKPHPTLTECSGKTVCKPTEKSSELNGPMPFWKVALIAGLTATGGTIFIIVAVVAYISYNKLKVRPELTINGYHNNPQNVTRV